ncbi:PREDICTED: uncharacterized protein LOC104611658 isoform X2 [Nelumbo nucifera]|uniref:Uncharacterized protein LOC104611658 isoform X2 n=1 Tax=Nelumbo nucifera TaxID=4432 RepID=A0A1U8BJ78_NELNU|nr:PREDICTED: uncharacterized protein LOC104611658 isoform X2 [Nelumbo nucifera]
MASNFDRWEKDPFFSAAEEVQESADRMESAYRTWIHETKEASGMCDSDELRRDLHTALGTAKWQLEEFERAVRSSYRHSSAQDARTRHRQFIAAIESKIATVENSLKELVHAEGKSLPWVSLDEGERDELALFLSSPSSHGDRIPATIPGRDEEEGAPPGVRGESLPDCSKNWNHSADCGSQETKDDRLHGHWRTTSASADIGLWKIAIDHEDFQNSSFDRPPDLPPPKVLSFSGFLRTMEPLSKLKWTKNGFRKWKCGDRYQAEGTSLLRSDQLGRGINACYERSKSCIDGYDDSYDKQLYGCFGAVQRQLQRSQYQIQYGRPIQLIIWVALALFLIALFALSAICGSSS